MASKPPSSTKPARKTRKAPLVSLAGAVKYLRVKEGKAPSRGLLSYHIAEGHLIPDKRLPLLNGIQYGFQRSTLQEFARKQGWEYVAKDAQGE